MIIKIIMADGSPISINTLMLRYNLNIRIFWVTLFKNLSLIPKLICLEWHAWR